jgi:hypothetical protein
MRYAIFFTLGVALGSVVGAVRGTPLLGFMSGLLLGSGFAFWYGMNASARRLGGRSIGFFTLGLIALVIGGAAFFPRVIFVPRWVTPLSVVDEGETIRILTDREDAALDPALVKARAIYERAFIELFGEEAKKCTLDVVIVHDASAREVLVRGSGVTGDFGSYHAPLLSRPVVVTPVGAGWGSLAHHAMYRMATCATGARHTWLVMGLASLVEKHTIDPATGAFYLKHRSDWRPLDVALQSEKRNLMKEFDRGADQSFLRSFFLYLNDENMLRPFLNEITGGASPIGALARVTAIPPHQIEQQWRTWLETRAHALPVLRSAKPFEGAPDL